MTHRIVRTIALAGSAAAMLACPVAATAETVSGIRVTAVGVQGAQIYIHAAQSLPNCPGNVIYQAANSTGQFVMSVAVTARTTGILLGRIDYHVSDQGTCWVDLIQL